VIPRVRTRLLAAIVRFDERADAVFETLRGHRTFDKVMTTATHAGEFSAIWHVVGLVRGLVTGRVDQTVALAAGIGAESLVVNQGIKRLFRRARPTTGGDTRFAIRTPLTSSFPSGHASAAAFAALTLIRWDGPRTIPIWGTVAAAVALSRPYVRIHHASDVVGGVVVGATMAGLANQVYKRIGIT
jgi:membrane-associated phospholipid phosphatase